MKPPLSAVQAETWDLCCAHFEALACDTAREAIPDAHLRQHVTALLRARFADARRSCLSDTPPERRTLGADYGAAT